MRFRQYAHGIRSAGFRRYSAHALIYHIRFTHDLQRGPNQRFKIDNFASRYARLLAALNPSFAKFFELRRLKSP